MSTAPSQSQTETNERSGRTTAPETETSKKTTTRAESETSKKTTRGPETESSKKTTSKAETDSSKKTTRADESTKQTGHDTGDSIAEPVEKTFEVTDVPALTEEDHIDQCGLEDDRHKWAKWAGPKRIRTCQLTAEESAKIKGHLDLLFSHEVAVLGERVVFNPHDVMEVMLKVIPYLKSEPILIEDVPNDVTIVGDIHGQLYDLDRIFKDASRDGKPGWESTKFVFMGDYVDRGRQQLEVVMALFCIKMLYPNDIFLLRGNHEFMRCQLQNDFHYHMNELYDKDDARVLFFQINATFSWLSVAAIVGDVYWCSHGGMSPTCLTRYQMRGIYKPIIKSTDDIAIHDICWSDPAEGLRGTTYNSERNASVYFGCDALVRAMASMEVKAVFRGHTVMTDGFSDSWGLLYTIFSATDNQGFGNKGAVAVIDACGKLAIRIFEVDPNRGAWEAALNELSGKPTETGGDPKSEHEMGTGRIANIADAKMDEK